MKLSHVSRSSSFSKLEQRLGKYEERGSEIKISDPSESEPKVLPRTTQWEEYQREREKYFESKKSAIKDLKLEQKEERERLHELQRSRWEELHSESWRGRRDELNQLRCLIAYAHKKEQLNLRDAQREEMEEVKSRYPRRFPSYKEWLSKNRAGEYCRKLEYVMMKPLQSPTPLVESSRGIDLRSYDARRGAGSSVLYCRSGTYTADFSDMGSRIVLNKRRLTEETVLSALQLANAKWGATEITGNDEYKKLCVSLAVKHGLKLANPELSAEVERQKRERCQLFHSDSGITAAEIFRLNLIENPRIYVNPRTDNQQYKGQLVHVDEERGYCVQLVGQQSLFVHKLDALEFVPKAGEKLKISYTNGVGKAKVQTYEERQHMRSL